MLNTTLEHILMKKFKEGHLAGFYVLKPPFLIGNPDLFLETWITDLLSKFLGTHRGVSEKKAMESLSQGHPDILFLRKKDQKATYIWNKQENDFKDFLKFLYFRPFELPHKFIIFTQAHLIPKDISNKLLKSLEDIPEKTTLFFLLPAQKSLLPTISSRALEVTLPLPEETKRKIEQEATPEFFPSQDIGTWFENNVSWGPLEEATSQLQLPEELKGPLLHFFKEKEGENKIIEYLKKNPSFQDNLITCLVTWETRHLSHFRDKERALKELKWNLLSTRYRNPSSERLFSLLWAFQPAAMDLDKREKSHDHGHLKS
ncbi:hypothetical protein OAK75_01345 [Bacteriovoracales bacterium]|nr:hypothetical protein [Bacteriovoracales bacterium]